MEGLVESHLGGRFTLQEKVGQGAMGAVWRALDSSTGSPVAIKLLNAAGPAATAGFLREIEALAELRHPNIVGYVAHGLAESGEPFLAMEWLEGLDLQQYLATQMLLPDEACLLAEQVLQALRVAHGRGLVHRDLKPANIFLCNGDVAKVKVLDFGIAKRLIEQPNDATRLAVGTPVYMSPEQARALPNIDGRSDFFSLGSLLYEAISGIAPFDGKTHLAVLAKVCLDEPIPLSTICPQVPSRLESLITDMMAKQAADRPNDAEALLQNLVHVGGPLSGVYAAFNDSLSTDEQRVVFVLMSKFSAADSDGDGPPQDVVQTMENTTALHSLPEALLQTLGRLDADFSQLMDGTLLATCSGKASALELAARAARCAIAIRRAFPKAITAISVGRSVIKQGLPFGKTLDETTTRLAASKLGDISVDEETALLLARNFAVRNHSQRWLLVDDAYSTPIPVTSSASQRLFVGREAELAQMANDFSEVCGSHSPRFVTYVADAGAGKTRLTSEWFAHLRRQGNVGFKLWRSQGDPLQAVSPLGFVKQLMLGALGLSHDTPRKERRAAVTAFLGVPHSGEREPLAVLYLAELVEATPTPESESALYSARNDPRIMAEQMSLALSDALRMGTAKQPLILLLQDLQWADAASLRLLDAAFGFMGPRSCFVLALARPSFDTVHPKLWAERGMQIRKLDALSGPEATQLIQALLPGEIAGDADWVAERAQGNPFFIEELSRTLRRRGKLQIPEAVIGTVQARLDDLPAPARRILRAASIYGRKFSRDSLVPLLGGDDSAQMSECLSLMVKEDILAVEDQNNYSFWQELTREAIYKSLTDGDRVLGHRLAARWLESSENAAPSLLLEHAVRGIDAPRVCTYAEMAAEKSYRSGDLEGALAFVARAFGGNPDGRQIGRLHLIESKTLRWLGRTNDGKAPVKQALANLEEGSFDWFMALECAAWVFAESLDKDELMVVAEKASRVAPKHDAHEGRVIALAVIARGLLALGMIDRCATLLSLADQEDNGSLTALAKSRLLSVHGACERRNGRIGPALRYYKEALSQVETLDDEAAKLDPRNNVLVTLLECGAFDEAQIHVKAALASAQRIRSCMYEGIYEANMGLIAMAQGRLDQADTLFEQAAKHFRGLGATWLEANLSLYRAHLAVHQNRPTVTLFYVETLLGDANLPPPLRPYALALAAKACLLEQRPVKAMELAEAARRLVDEDGIAPEEGEVFMRSVFAEAELANGKRAKAHQTLLASQAKLRERVGEIDDPRLAASFMDIPDHRRITLALQQSEAGHTLP